MKNFFNITTRLFLIPLLFFTACKMDPDINHYKLEVQLTSSEELVEIDMEGAQVTLKNVNKNYSYTASVNKNGTAVFEPIESGLYTLSSSFTQTFNNEEISLNAYASIIISENTNKELLLVDGKIGDFVIKEFYYSGCLTTAGNPYYSDQFVEIYNNTAEILYADGISIVEHQSYGNEESYWNYLAKDSIVVKMIWTIPGDGESYPVLPGESIVLARDGLNHQSDPNGNSNSPVDLANAEFEFWSNKTATGDIDFAATNMIENLWVFKGTDISFFTRGGSAIALIRLPQPIDEYINNNLITEGTATSTSKYYCKINNNLVIDAVETMRINFINKRFDNSLDAGYTMIEAGSKSGLGVRRKVLAIENGRVIYQDTNNSSNDFEHDVIPTPKVYGL